LKIIGDSTEKETLNLHTFAEETKKDKEEFFIIFNVEKNIEKKKENE
jgi:hypothetical protein